MIRIGFVVVSFIFTISCASPPSIKEPVKLAPQPIVKKNRLPDRPLAFGEEYVFQRNKTSQSILIVCNIGIINSLLLVGRLLNYL